MVKNSHLSWLLAAKASARQKVIFISGSVSLTFKTKFTANICHVCEHCDEMWTFASDRDDEFQTDAIGEQGDKMTTVAGKL